MEYLLKVSAVVAIFYFSYKLFLQRDTFFEQNRWFLLIGLISAFLVPFFVIAEYVEYTPVAIDTHAFGEVIANNNANSFNIIDYLPVVYAIGVLFFALRFLIQISSLFNLILKNKRSKKGSYIFVETDVDVSPFSFFNYIVYNPNQFSETELEQIITHEKIHVKQYHSVDVLLIQIACILLWFNPFIWFYNKDLKQNLEFLADHAAVNYSNCKKAYQYTLLKTSLPTHQLALSNHFYNSLIKKRIVMLHKSKSKKINQIKFALVIPLLVLFLMSFNTKTVYIEKEIPVNELLVPAIPFEIYNKPISDNITSTPQIETQETETSLKSTPEKQTKKESAKKDLVEAMITKNTTDAEFDKIASMLKDHGVTIKFKSIKRNDKGEITAIKIDASSKNSNANFNLNSNNAIKPIKISYNNDDDNLAIGNVEKAKEVSYIYSSDDNAKVHKIHTTGEASKAYFISHDDEIHEIHGDSIHFINSDDAKHIKIRKNNHIEIISGDDNNDVEVIIESDKDVENEEDIIITKAKTGKAYKVKTIAKSGGDSKVFITTDGDEDPLYIVDGKEVDNDKIKDLIPDNIKEINVLKGDNATKKYGDKGKDGVIEITTKNKN